MAGEVAQSCYEIAVIGSREETSSKRLMVMERGVVSLRQATGESS